MASARESSGDITAVTSGAWTSSSFSTTPGCARSPLRSGSHQFLADADVLESFCYDNEKDRAHLGKTMKRSAAVIRSDYFSSAGSDDGGGSGVGGLSAAGGSKVMLLGGGSSRASLKVFFTPCQKLFVKTSFTASPRK